jgi:predicted RNase H-like nuclease (RuvC/YqgF family)
MLQWILGIIAAVAVPVFGYLAVVRRASGRIQTTEASKLWDEAAMLRKDYRAEISNQLELIASLRARISDLERDNDRLNRENMQILKRVANIEETNGV